jgi:hypothetical protein
MAMDITYSGKFEAENIAVFIFNLKFRKAHLKHYKFIIFCAEQQILFRPFSIKTINLASD